MIVLLTCKNKEDTIKNEGARVITTLYVDFSDAQGQITLESVVVSSRNWNSSKLSCMSSLPTRMKMIHTKMKELECSQDFSHYKSMGIFSRCSRAANSAVLCRIWLKFELVPDIMVVLLTCKYEEDPIKNNGARVFTTLYIDFSDAQGQITLKSVVVSSQNWNSSKLSCMSSLTTRMKMIHTKMKELECSQDFSHYNSMRIFPDAQGQLTPQSLVKSGPNSNLSEILWLS